MGTLAGWVVGGREPGLLRRTRVVGASLRQQAPMAAC